ncbi:MAG: right-handed parallel beta-helix repeat-containing protein [Planctomycetota bacterium]|jgi:predicted outer membrane repeat protein
MWFPKILICLLFSAQLAVANIINVPGDQPTIQAGIDAAIDFDTIFVATGTYSEIIDFLGKAICLKGERGDDSVVLTSPGSLPNGYLISFISGEGVLSIIDGFTFQSIVHSNGVIRIESSSATIRDCIFRNNQNVSTGWGTLAMHGGDSLIVEDCHFEPNVGCPISMNCGYGEFRRNVFINNISSGIYGGAISVGGNICKSHVIIEDNLIVGNSAQYGGGIFLSQNDTSS